MTPPLAPWPVEYGGYPTVEDLHDYERARADAWEERCRLAVEALHHDAYVLGCEGARETLEKIGELPPAGAGG